MKVVFRVDASFEIGSGHVMRCLTLSQELARRGASVLFVSRTHPGHLCDVIADAGFHVVRLPVARLESTAPGARPYAGWLGSAWEADAAETRTAIEAWSAGADWIIVDHYGLDGDWEAAMRSHARHVFVIDDLADRNHHCDVLLDQNFYDDPLHRYDGKIDPHCRTLIGPEYALLRDEFRLARSSLGSRSGRISRVLIAFGGADMGNETAKAIEAFRSVTEPRLTGIVVTGVLNPHHAEIERLCGSDHRLVLRQQVRDMARCMAEADLAIGAGGAMSWERCCVGLPSIVIAIAANQEQIAESLARRGACWYLGPAERVSALDIVQCIDGCTKDPTAVRRVSKAATELSPGDGARKVCDVLMQLSG